MDTNKSLQQQLEEAIEWLAFNRGKIFLGAVALLVVSVAGGTVGRYLWRAIETSGQIPLEGRVLLDGELVRYGTVTLLTENGGIFQTTINGDGTYRFDHVPAGSLRVAVSSPNPQSVFERQPAIDEPRREPPPGSGRTPPAGASASDTPAAGLGATTVAMPVTTDEPVRHPPISLQRRWFPLPGQYANPATSGLAVVVGATPEPQDLRLTRPDTASVPSGDTRRLPKR